MYFQQEVIYQTRWRFMSPLRQSGLGGGHGLSGKMSTKNECRIGVGEKKMSCAFHSEFGR